MSNDSELEQLSTHSKATTGTAYAEPSAQDLFLKEGSAGWAGIEAPAVKAVAKQDESSDPGSSANGVPPSTGEVPDGSSQRSVASEAQSAVSESEPKAERDRSVTPTYGMNTNLSKAEINHLISVAGDHSKPEEEWMRACHLLGDYTHRPPQKVMGRFIAAGLTFLLLAGSGVGIFMYLHNVQPEPTIATPPVIAAPNYSGYMAHLQRRIKRNWFPPKSAMSKHVVVEFKILRNGTMEDARVTQSAGDLSDRAALRALELAAPFQPLPAGSSPDVTIQFTFDYNLWTQKSKLPTEHAVSSASSDSVSGNGGEDAFSSSSSSSASGSSSSSASAASTSGGTN